LFLKLSELELKFNIKTEKTHGKPAGQNIFDHPCHIVMNMSVSNITQPRNQPLLLLKVWTMLAW